MNSEGEIFATNEESRQALQAQIDKWEETKAKEKIRLLEELQAKERAALVDIPLEELQDVVNMNREQRRQFYRDKTRKRGKGYTR